MLSRNRFIEVVRDMPLISIDLVVLFEGKVLLGQRCNEPAKGYWFVPGGRIVKNEHINQAFCRISQQELGVEIPIAHANFLGVYEHLYDTNFSESGGFGTHYVVLAYTVTLDQPLAELPTQQHSEYRWLDIKKINNEDSIHDNTKAYFT